MSKILITGGLGYVGGRLSRRLSAEHEVYVSSRRNVSADVLQLHGNVRRINHQDLFSSAGFPVTMDVVIHLAALNEIDSSKNPAEASRVNVDETRRILENSISSGVAQFIYFSTAHIYGSPLVGKITEESRPVPVHPYAITHYEAETFVVTATRENRIRGLVLRMSNAFGAPVDPAVNRWTLLANDLCRQAVEKGKLSLLSNGGQYRDFICLSDVEEIIAALPGKNTHHIVYNLGSGKSIRVIDMAKKISRLASERLQKEISIELPAHTADTEDKELYFSIDRLLTEGFRISNPVNEELDHLLRFCSENFVAVD